MSNQLFGSVWDEAEDGGFSDAEVVAPGEYAIECAQAGVGSNDRIWTLWTITTGPDAGTSFFGPNHGLTVRDPAKTKKVQGMFKNAMLAYGIGEEFFRVATSLDDFAEAIKGVQGMAAVKVRAYKSKDGDERQANDFKKFTATARPPLPSVGGVPNVAALTQAPPAGTAAPVPGIAAAPGAGAHPVQQVPAQPQPAVEQQPVVQPVDQQQPVVLGVPVVTPGAPVVGVPGTQDGPPVQDQPQPVAATINITDEPDF